jgi:hypothetical protein
MFDSDWLMYLIPIVWPLAIILIILYLVVKYAQGKFEDIIIKFFHKKTTGTA